MLWSCPPADNSPAPTQQGSTSNTHPSTATAAPEFIAEPKPEPKPPLETAYALRINGQGGVELYAALEQARDVLPKCAWATGDTVPRWASVRLNRTGAGLDAIQIRSDLKTPADLLLALAGTYDAAMLELFMIGPNGVVCHADKPLPRRDLDLGEDGVSGRNVVAFQRVAGGQIQPSSNYYLCFRLTGRRPVDVQLKLKLLEGELPPIPVTIHDMARELNFELPFRFSAAAPLVDRVRDTLEFSGHKAAILLLDEAEAQGASSRQVAYLKALMTHEAAKRLAASNDPDAADAMFLEAAQLFRAAGRVHSAFTTEEHNSFGSAFYDEARVFARRGENDSAIESLQAAVLFGFTKIQHLQQDEDLAGLRDMPEFQSLVSEYLNELP